MLLLIVKEEDGRKLEVVRGRKDPLDACQVPVLANVEHQ